MDRYVPQDGLVRSLADDLTDVESLMSSNLRNRYEIILGEGNIKISGPESCEFYHDIDQSAPLEFWIQCKQIEAIRFNDGSVYAPANPAEKILRHVGLIEGEIYSVCLRKIIDYSETGTYAPGYPSPVPPEGVSLFEEIDVELLVPLKSSIESSSTTLVLYDIYSNGTNIVIEEDYRSDLAIIIPVRGVHLIPEPVTDMFLSTLYGSDIGQAGTSAGVGTSRVFDSDSSMNRETMLQIEWEPSKDAWMYEVKVVPYINEYPNEDYALIKVKINDGLSIQKVLIPYANAQKVDVTITPLSQSIFRDRGESTMLSEFRLGSDRVGIDTPIPGIGVELMNTMPRSAKFSMTVSPSNSLMIAEVTLFGASGTFIIHRGNFGEITLPVPAGTWTPSIVGILPSGTRTSVAEGAQFSVPSPSAEPECVETLQTVPLAFYAVPGDTLKIAGYFYGPSGGTVLHKVIFCSLGSYRYYSHSMSAVDITFNVAPIDNLGLGEEILSIVESEGEFSWPTAVDTGPLGLYNLNFSNSEVDMPIEDSILYRVDVDFGGPLGSYNYLILGGTLLLSMLPVSEFPVEEI